MNGNITDESGTDGLASTPPPPPINDTHCEARILEIS